MEESGALLDMPHLAQKRYPDQRIFVVAIDGYACCVPYVVDGGTRILKTVYPHRKFRYLIEESDHG